MKKCWAAFKLSVAYKKLINIWCSFKSSCCIPKNNKTDIPPDTPINKK